MRRLVLFLMLLGIALAPAMAEARAGKGGSFGSRGGRTYQAPPSTPTAPTARPMERSVTPTQSAANPAAQPAAPRQPPFAPQTSFWQRNPFMAGLMGGLIGAGIGGLLFGHGFGWDGLGLAGGLGVLLQVALIGGLIWLAMSFFRRREATAHAYAPSAAGAAPEQLEWTRERRMPDVAPLDIGSGRGTVAPESEPNLAKSDFDDFERILRDVQGAWTRADVNTLRRLVTPEMLSYFSEQLSDDVSAGHANRVEDVKLEQGDLSETWREGEREFTTVAMRWSSRDYTVDSETGRLVDGSDQNRVESVEYWTFTRVPGGRWLVSAVQQV